MATTMVDLLLRPDLLSRAERLDCERRIEQSTGRTLDGPVHQRYSAWWCSTPDQTS